MTDNATEPRPKGRGPAEGGNEHAPPPAEPGLTVADCLHIAVDAIDAAAMSGHYAHLDAEGKAKIRTAQNLLSRMAINAQRATQSPGGNAGGPAKPGAAKPAKARKGTKPKNGSPKRKRQ